MADFKITHTSKFIDGVNYQLHYGFDFGEHPFVPRLGTHHEDRMALVRNDFALLSAHGVHAVRMNIFTDGRNGILFDEFGRARGIQDSVIRGALDVLRAARDNSILVSFVLLDHKFAERAAWTDPMRPELGTKQGHGRLLLTETGRQDLMYNVLRPLLRELRGAMPSSLLSIELMNEPESLVEGLSTDPEMPHLIPRHEVGEFKRYMCEFRDLVHQETSAQFTVGSLALTLASTWLDVLDPSADYLSVHYYGTNGDPPYRHLYSRRKQANAVKSVEELQNIIPLVWGEYAANGSTAFANHEYPQGFARAYDFLSDALNNGMKGAFAWAFRSGIGEMGDLFGPVPLEEHRMFTARFASRVEFAGSLPPGPLTSVHSHPSLPTSDADRRLT
jgi:hypothetical protein